MVCHARYLAGAAISSIRVPTMLPRSHAIALFASTLSVLSVPGLAAADELPRLRYNDPDLTVDLGVGLWAWPLPMDYDRDGDMDLVVACPDVPSNGTYFFENVGPMPMPRFAPAVRIGDGPRNLQVSYVDGQPRILSPGVEYQAFRDSAFAKRAPVHGRQNVHDLPDGVRANQWKYADYDGDGRLDLIVGVGDWSDYGWDDAFNADGEWTNGPLHGYVYLLRNRGTTQRPDYEPPRKIVADDRPVDVFGMPSPSLADFDGDGDLDLLCGEFLDGFTYFQNAGTRQSPRYVQTGSFTCQGRPITMDLQMITPTAVDWDNDGDVDLVVGDEDGRVALIRSAGKVYQGRPRLYPPRYFPAAGGLRQVRCPGHALRVRLGHRRGRRSYLRQYGRLHWVDRESRRQSDSLGPAGQAAGRWGDDSDSSRRERLDSGPRRGEVGVTQRSVSLIGITMGGTM